MNSSFDVSIVICCYNSSTRIKTTLQYLSKQNFDSIKCEIILVDNNCNDNTVQIAKSTWIDCKSPFPLRIEAEKQPGLSHARKKGVFAASGEIIIFCDDDNWLDEDYLRIAHETMTSNNAIGVLAGQSRAVSDVEIPTWFYSYYGNYACGVLGLNSGM